ncbi:hypothetical protein ABVT39_014240, partial [Epinephelus coioides]
MSHTTQKPIQAVNRPSLHLRPHKSTTKNVRDTFQDPPKCNNAIVTPQLPDYFKCLHLLRRPAAKVASERRLGDTVIARRQIGTCHAAFKPL